MLTPQDGLLSYILPTRTAHAGRASVSCAKVSACNLLAKMGFCAAQEPDQMLSGERKNHCEKSPTTGAICQSSIRAV
jgi:hypothetical protein